MVLGRVLLLPTWLGPREARGPQPLQMRPALGLGKLKLHPLPQFMMLFNCLLTVATDYCNRLWHGTLYLLCQAGRNSRRNTFCMLLIVIVFMVLCIASHTVR